VEFHAIPRHNSTVAPTCGIQGVPLTLSSNSSIKVDLPVGMVANAMVHVCCFILK
jgi:hypothetical protein